MIGEAGGPSVSESALPERSSELGCGGGAWVRTGVGRGGSVCESVGATLDGVGLTWDGPCNEGGAASGWMGAQLGGGGCTNDGGDCNGGAAGEDGTRGGDPPEGSRGNVGDTAAGGTGRVRDSGVSTGGGNSDIVSGVDLKDDDDRRSRASSLDTNGFCIRIGSCVGITAARSSSCGSSFTGSSAEGVVDGNTLSEYSIIAAAPPVDVTLASAVSTLRSVLMTSSLSIEAARTAALRFFRAAALRLWVAGGGSGVGDGI